MDSRTNDGHHVVIVGAGATGTLAAAHLLRTTTRSGPPLLLSLVDPAEQPGRGVAYGTSHERHLLNVPAGRMSAYATDPGHFVRWLADRTGTPHAGPDYVPRRQFGQYLEDVLTEAALPMAGQVDLRHVRTRAVGLRPMADGILVELDGGEELRADALVLALGNPPQQSAWAPESLRSSPAFIPTPWAPGALDNLPDESDLLLVGTGLTMVDVSIGAIRPGRVVHAVSRRGLVPQSHTTSAVAVPPPNLEGMPDLARLRKAVLRHFADCRREHGDWRVGVDSLRPLTARLWQGLEPAGQAAFLRDHQRVWDVHRHRLAPQTAARLAEATASGLLSVGRGEVADATNADPGLLVTLTDGRRLRVGAVIDCTQPDPLVTRSADPLLRSALASGLVRPGPHGIGFATRSDGRLVSGDEGHEPPAWTLGPTRRGNLLETTAIPEIRAQAATVAEAITAELRTGVASRVPIRATSTSP